MKNSVSTGWVLLAGGGLLAMLVGLAVCGYPETPNCDSGAYIQMAAGGLDQVTKPFANRILHPFAVRSMSLVTGWDNDQAFVVVSLFALCMFMAGVAYLMRHTLSAGSFVLLLATPLLLHSLQQVYMPDLVHAAFLALFFVALHRRMMVVALLLLLALQLVRESSVLLTVVAVAVALWQRRWRFAVGAVAATLAGMLVTAAVTRSAQPNFHHLGTMAYLFSKAVANTLNNIFGVIPWANTYATHAPEHYAEAPIWKMALPSWLSVGAIREVGIYRFNGINPAVTVFTMLTAFGVLPGLLLARKARAWRQVLSADTTMVLPVAAVYGALSFMLVPVLGMSLERYVGYAWPAFWIALPLLVQQTQGAARMLLPKWLWCCQAGCSLLLAAFSVPCLQPQWTFGMLVVLVLLLNVLAWRWARAHAGGRMEQDPWVKAATRGC